MNFINETMEKLQAGDIQTGLLVLVALLILFFLLKGLLSTAKAIIIVIASIVILTLLLPEAGIIEKTKELGTDAFDYAKEKVNEEVLKSTKEVIKDKLN